jgi:hypothetical protein
MWYAEVWRELWTIYHLDTAGVVTLQFAVGRPTNFRIAWSLRFSEPSAAEAVKSTVTEPVMFTEAIPAIAASIVCSWSFRTVPHVFTLSLKP